MTDEEALANFSTGITDPANVAIAIDRVPCAIETVEGAIKDVTNIDVNAPRALMVVQYKGLLIGLALAEAAAKPEPPDQQCMEVYAGVAIDKIIRSFTAEINKEWWELTAALRSQRREEWLRMIKLQMRACIEEDAE